MFSLKLREQVKVKWENGLRGLVLRGEEEGEVRQTVCLWSGNGIRAQAGHGHHHLQGTVCATRSSD